MIQTPNLKKFLLLSTVLFTLTIHGVIAQEQDTLPYPHKQPAQVSIIPGVGTNGVNPANYYQPYSFNFIGGKNGGASGFEMAGIFNKNLYFVRGFQIAGIVNVVEGSVTGVQVAGISNITKGSTNGFQLAGITNQSRESSKARQIAGIVNFSKGSRNNQQFAGIINIIDGNTQAVQIAGITNVSKENMNGIQISGIFNRVHERLNGVQVTGMFNRVNSIKGVQIGLINSAKEVKGLQVGLFNEADSADATLGLINVVKNNGYYRGEIWASETFFGNAAFKMGTKKLHSVLTIGWREKDNVYHLGYGLGLGSELVNWDSTALNMDLLWYQLAENELWTNNGNHHLYQSRLTFEKRIKNHNSLFLGLTANLLNSKFRSNTNDFIGMDMAPNYAKQKRTDNSLFSMWPGINVGVRF